MNLINTIKAIFKKPKVAKVEKLHSCKCGNHIFNSFSTWYLMKLKDISEPHKDDNMECVSGEEYTCPKCGSRAHIHFNYHTMVKLIEKQIQENLNL